MDIIKKKKENINNVLFKEYFDYSNPDTMIKRLKDAGHEKDKNMVKNLNKMQKIFKNVPEDKTFKIKENEKVTDIVERILELNSKKQLGLRLKILTPNQMLSRLPITLAQLKAGNSSEKLKNEIRQLLYFCADKKNLQNNFIKVWSTLFKNGNNLYEHWK